MGDEKNSGLDFAGLAGLSGAELAEKVVGLALSGPAAIPPGLAGLARQLENLATGGLNVVVFGGGTGLSNLVGGDSRHPLWPAAPFQGLKEVFPKTRAVVCITDDGGSTGELLKDLDLIAIGDLRHVLLSSVSRGGLQECYGLAEQGCRQTAAVLHRLFNYRFNTPPVDPGTLLAGAEIDPAALPGPLAAAVNDLLAALFEDRRLRKLLQRPHCLGNLLVVAAIRRHSELDDFSRDHPALIAAFHYLAELLGAGRDAVLPCSLTPAHLKLLYTNGVLVSGEYKAGHARRGCPVERIFVHSHGEPEVPAEVIDNIAAADIIVFAPGSLYTSIIPILQLPVISEAVRANGRALKLLVSNLWVQKGETDLVSCPSKRRFYVSDLLLAYNRNIPGGVAELFHQVMVLGLHEIPGNILQSYALEGKVPIYFDREKVSGLGFMPVECQIYSDTALKERAVVQHDPGAMARAVRAVWAVHDQLDGFPPGSLPLEKASNSLIVGSALDTSALRLTAVSDLLAGMAVDSRLRERLLDIIWRHRDITLAHLGNFAGLVLVDRRDWSRSQDWDRIYSFYDPGDRLIKIRQDVFDDSNRFELAFLVALGESLLGDYAAKKEMRPVENGAGVLGRIYQLTVRPQAERHSFFGDRDLDEYLGLARMCRSAQNPRVYTRLLNGTEGFTPPGLLFGLMFAWYLDNRFAAHIEYKMSILQMEVSDMIPEQAKGSERRRRMVDFFRRRVFGYDE
ncbi:MAG: YvcK family protein [Desulfurivibrionaceae bacterium]|nr:YvcK family protein [Desulfurivibrionaceae bacterium]